MPNYGLAVIHDIDDHVSYALLLDSTYGDDERRGYQRLLDDLNDYKLMALDPLLLPALALSLSTKRSRDLISKITTKVEELENTTGHTPYGEEDVANNAERNFLSLRLNASKLISRCDIQFAVIKSRLSHLEKARLVFTSLGDEKKKKNDTAAEDTTGCGERFIAYLVSKNEYLLNNTQLVHSRVGTQLAVVRSSLTARKLLVGSQGTNPCEQIDQERNIAIATAAQEDGAVMREISAATKRDSSAMKILAIITIVFLPGTFLGVRFFIFIGRRCYNTAVGWIITEANQARPFSVLHWITGRYTLGSLSE